MTHLGPPRPVAEYRAEQAAECVATIGEVFGCFTVIGIDRVVPHFGTYVHVQCGCGEPDSRRLSSLRIAAPKLGCRACKHLRMALRMYPLRHVDRRSLAHRALSARGSWRP